MHLPTGGRHHLGTAEFYNGSLSIHLNITNNTIYGDITKVDFESCYIQTTYGIERYEATPFVINIIVFGALTALKMNFFEPGLELPRNFSLLYVNNPYLGYYDDYIALAMTPVFKKIPPKPKNKTIDDDDNKKNNTNATLLTTTSQTVYSILDTLMSSLYDLTEKVTSPFRKPPFSDAGECSLVSSTNLFEICLN
jgi:hypothetical protein